MGLSPVWQGGGQGVEESSKKEKTHGLMDMDNSIVNTGGGAIRRVDGNGKENKKLKKLIWKSKTKDYSIY